MKKIVQTAGRNALNDFSPEFAHFNDDVLFGENWNNQDIDLKTRSIITVVDRQLRRRSLQPDNLGLPYNIFYYSLRNCEARYAVGLQLPKHL